jgi:hypothetical protein
VEKLETLQKTFSAHWAKAQALKLTLKKGGARKKYLKMECFDKNKTTVKAFIINRC